VIGKGELSQRMHVGCWISNYRSFAKYGDASGWCSAATHARGFSGACHEAEEGYVSEGLEPNKTTLSAAVTATDAAIPLASISGFASDGLAEGFSIKIDDEQIDYAGISVNRLTGIVRGANGTKATSHKQGAQVDYLKFGQCLEQSHETYVWNNDVNGKVVEQINAILVCGFNNDCVGAAGPDYTNYDIKSYAERPKNWQYRNDGTGYSYTPYPYPHPLITSAVSRPRERI
jgi:hypothetical protein